MTAFVLLCAGCLVAATDTTPSDPDRAAYEAARAQVGRDADAHVKLALWCEERGLRAERMKHLAIAVLRDPTNAMARGLLGLVAYKGQWKRPEAVSDQVKADAARSAALAGYNTRREKVGNSAEGHWKLGLWCEEQGLKTEALAHFAVVTRLDPSRQAAWKRLGCKKVNGRWTTEAQIQTEQAETEARKQGDRHWKPLLTKWRTWLGEKDNRDQAEKALAEVTDPYAVPSIWAVFVVGRESGQARAVQLFGQIDSPESSRAMALLAVFSDSAEVRRAATETLRNRDSRDFLGQVIAMLRKRVKYDVRTVGGPGSPGVLFVEGTRFNIERLYAPPPMPNIPILAGDTTLFDQYGLPVISRFVGLSLKRESSVQTEHTDLGAYVPNGGAAGTRFVQRHGFRWTRTTTVTQTTSTPVLKSVQIPIGSLMLQYQMSAFAAQQQLVGDVQAIEDANTVTDAWNERVSQVLQGVTGQDFGMNQEVWTKWYVDQLGYAYSPPQPSPKPTLVEDVPLAFVPQGVIPTTQNQLGSPVTSSSSSSSIGHNCFKAGTPVRTLESLRPIESIRVGDQVLTQDARNGTLSYQPVVAVFHNQPSPTLKIDLDDESIVATPIHRFWKAGQGWTMARELKPGDTLRTIGGSARIVSVGSEPVQPVFNIEVASGQSFFVGNRGALVHDNSLVLPVIDPFDAPPSLAALTRSGESGE